MSPRAAPAVLLALVALAYATAWRATFQFDDWNVIVGNADVHGLAAWLASMPGIRPLTKLGYAVNWALDPRPAGFVAFNLACHVASALLVLELARTWIAALAPHVTRTGLAAFLVAATFALHPAQTEAVTYVAGRSVSLSSCLYLASLVAWERGREGAMRWRAASVAAFALALAARETAWTLPFAILLVERARGTRWRAALSGLRWHGVALALAGVAIAASPTYRRLLGTSFAVRGPLDNLAAQVDAIGYLVTHPLVTLRVNIDPDVALTAFGAAWMAKAGALLLAVACAALAWRSRPWLAFAVLWFLLQLLPTNGPVARLDLANDRQLYLASIGPALALAVVVARATAVSVANVSTVALVGTLMLATLVRNTDYASEVALWEATSTASPRKSRVWNNLGVALRDAGDTARARAAFERAIALDAEHYKAKRNLDELH